jgi:hypothetical protein
MAQLARYAGFQHVETVPTAGKSGTPLLPTNEDAADDSSSR